MSHQHHPPATLTDLSPRSPPSPVGAPNQAVQQRPQQGAGAVRQSLHDVWMPLEQLLNAVTKRWLQTWMASMGPMMATISKKNMLQLVQLVG
jgi:hypothetical protein